MRERFSLSDLDAIVAERAQASRETSYTAQLVASGAHRCARKLGEEAIETVIAALGDDRQALAGEAADLLYHLLVLLRVRDVPLDEVMTILEARTGQSGLAEKASRPKPEMQTGR